jgi:hypothetical protein
MSPRVIQALALTLCAALLLGAWQLTPAIQTGRQELNMIGAARPEENTPPEYAFFVQAFGAFRGILTNIAFIRAEMYKEQGRYYDAMQLAQWICMLQPRFPSVWEFHAWNMAWNISVTTYTPEERWNWVYNGVKLLRDQGLRYNPRAINLYKQLAWIFLNKMGDSTDEFHNAYKREWAWRMHLLLGPPPDPLGTYRPDRPILPPGGGIGEDELAAAVRRAKARQEGREPPPESSPPPAPSERTPDRSEPNQLTLADETAIATRASFDFIQSIEQAPRKLSELYAAHPEAREMVAQLAGLGVRIDDTELNEDSYWNAGGLAMTFFQRYRRQSDPPALLRRLLKDESAGPGTGAADEHLERFDQIVGVRRGDPAGQALLRFLQRKVLTEVYKLQPVVMGELIRTFGPMDWRLVEPHSLYWVQRALVEGEETISSFKNDKTNTARLIFFSLRNLYLRNRLTFEPFYGDISLSYMNFAPDLHFIEAMHQAYLTYGPMIDPTPQEKGAGGTFRTGHINFLSEAIRLLYFYGRQGDALRYFRYLQENYGRQPDGTMNPAYAKTLRDFVFDSFYESELNERDTRNLISGLVLSGFDELSQGNFAEYTKLLNQARTFYMGYQLGESGRGLAEKLRLPPFADMLADTLRLWLSQPPTSYEVTLFKARLWIYLPLELRQAVYDDLLEQFRRECELWQFEPTRAFPEPPGMDEYRRQAGRRGPEKKEEKVETPAQQLR